MASFNITIPQVARPISESLGAMPKAFRELAKRGFRVLASIEKIHYPEIMRAVAVTLDTRESPFADLEKTLGRTREELSSLMAAAMVAVPMLGSGGTTQEFTAAALQADLLETDDVRQVVPFLDAIIADRAHLGRVLRRATASGETLPSLAAFDITVDVRIAFEDQAIVDGVAVVIVHVDTDADGGELWFQASKAQMERLKKDVDTALRRMELATAWVEGRSSS